MNWSTIETHWGHYSFASRWPTVFGGRTPTCRSRTGHTNRKSIRNQSLFSGKPSSRVEYASELDFPVNNLMEFQHE